MRKSCRTSFLSFLVLFFLAIPIVSIAQAPPLRFTKPRSYDPGGSYPSSLAVADVNGDGHLDLVIAYWTEGNVGVLLGRGDGTFQPAVKYAAGGTYAISVAVADVNGDGKPDIVVLNTWDEPGTVGVLLGNGDGTFQPPATYYTGDYSIPEAVAVGDLNGDGHPDIAVANFGHSDCDCNDGRVGVLWGNGDGTFQPMVFYASGGYDTVSITIVGGAWVVTNLCQDYYCDWPNGSVCWGRGCYDSGGQNPYSAAIGNLDGDGVPDIVVTNQISNPNNDPSQTLGVLLDFQTAVLSYPGGGSPDWVAIADLNGDGKADIAVNTNSGVGVLLGDGDGTFQTAITLGGGLAAVADVNGDGKPDLIGASSIMLNTSGFLTATHITSSLNPSLVDQLVTFTATVTSKKGSIHDGERVTFYDNARALTSVGLVGGTATYATSSLTAKTHTIKAAYAGDATLAPSTAVVSQKVLKYASTTALTSAPNPSTDGQSVTFTATITSAGPAPTGRVKFFDYGGPAFGAATVNGGVATLTYSKLLEGNHHITAEYSGDSANASSTSPVLKQVVQ
jgi:hypothetical protein